MATVPPSELDKGLLAALVPLYFAAGLALCYISVFHAPTAHHVEVGVVGSSAETAPVAQTLRASVGDGSSAKS